MRLLSPAPKRIAVSGAVIVICLVAQLILQIIPGRPGADRPVTSGVAFALSAQLSILLGSRLTGRHRPATRQPERPAAATRQAPVTVSLDRAAVS